jgi:Cu/Ag efflux protein CusF
LRGVIDSVDQGDDTISLRLSPQTTEQFTVQDGLVFNSVRYGDEVEVTVQDISGAKTIVGLKKQ